MQENIVMLSSQPEAGKPRQSLNLGPMKYFVKEFRVLRRRFRKKPNFCVVLHFVIIQRTKSTPHSTKFTTQGLTDSQNL